MQAHPSGVTFPGGESMRAMQARAVEAVRDWDARITEAHGPDAIWVAVSHADVIKSIVAEALGMHLDNFQRIVVDPCLGLGGRATRRSARSWSGTTSTAT